MPVRIDLVLYTVIPAVVAVGLHLLFRRVVKPHDLLPHHAVAGFLISVVGVIYAVVLGFVVVTVWVAFDSAQQTADLEASDVAELFGTAGAFPEPARSRLQRLMADYAFEVRDREWPMLAFGRQDLRARGFYLDALPAIASERSPEQSTQAALRGFALQQSALTMWHDLSLHRRERLISATAGHLPGGFYFALVIGGIIVLAFVFLFGVDNQTVQLTMTGLITALMGLLFGLIVSLDRPYTGGIRVS